MFFLYFHFFAPEERQSAALSFDANTQCLENSMETREWFSLIRDTTCGFRLVLRPRGLGAGGAGGGCAVLRRGAAPAAAAHRALLAAAVG